MELVKATYRSDRYTRQMQSQFAGYDHNLVIPETEFYDMKNLTSDFYPVMSTRSKRGTIGNYINPKGIFGGDKLALVDDGIFYYDGNKICEVSDTEKQFVRIGALLCIFPDKIVYNTKTNEVKAMEVLIKTSGDTRYSLCKIDGSAYNQYVGDTEPDTNRYKVWLDTSTVPNVLKEWAVSSAQWVEVPTSYIKIENDEIERLSEYDAVTIQDSVIADLNTDNIIYGAGPGYIIVAGIISESITQSTRVTINRAVPDMDYVTELNNRLWGCSTKNHEIYACKLGDPCNWRCYMGIASDSYSATIGVEGKFTGATSHLGYVLFFKQDAIIKITGTEPSNYSIVTTRCRGVQEGSEKSLVTINEILYYKSVNCICAYDGSLPQNISLPLGNDLYFDATAGYCKEKYYICMRNSGYDWSVFVYDTVKNMWHVEDTEEIKGFANVAGGLYLMDINNRLLLVNLDSLSKTIFPGMPNDEVLYPNDDLYPGKFFSYPTEESVSWMAETGDIGTDSPDTKYLSNLTLRLTIDIDAELRIYVQYDSDGEWKKVVELKNMERKQTKSIPIQLKRCDHVRLRYEGKGDCKIYSITKKIEGGSSSND